MGAGHWPVVIKFGTSLRGFQMTLSGNGKRQLCLRRHGGESPFDFYLHLCLSNRSMSSRVTIIVRESSLHPMKGGRVKRAKMKRPNKKKRTASRQKILVKATNV